MIIPAVLNTQSRRAPSQPNVLTIPATTTEKEQSAVRVWHPFPGPASRIGVEGREAIEEWHKRSSRETNFYFWQQAGISFHAHLFPIVRTLKSRDYTVKDSSSSALCSRWLSRFGMSSICSSVSCLLNCSSMQLL